MTDQSPRLFHLPLPDILLTNSDTVAAWRVFETKALALIGQQAFLKVKGQPAQKGIITQVHFADGLCAIFWHQVYRFLRNFHTYKRQWYLVGPQEYAMCVLDERVCLPRAHGNQIVLSCLPSFRLVIIKSNSN